MGPVRALIVLPLFAAPVPESSHAPEQAKPPAHAAPTPEQQPAGQGSNAPPFSAAPIEQASPQPLSTQSACVPECRQGYTCVSGQCVSACNPPCSAGFECNASRQCVVDLVPPLKQALKEYWAEQRAKTVHRHDDFYFRIGMNLGYAFDSIELGNFETTSKGLGAHLEYDVGVTGQYLTLGLGISSVSVFSASTAENGIEITQKHSASYTVIGLLLDVYPDPTKGFHAMGTFGIGMANVNPRNGEDTNTGFGLVAGAGYDFWIGEQWSMGPAARIMYVGGASDDFGKHRAVIPMLTLSVLWH